MNAIHGVHAGFRAVHAKGTCCRGTFVATAEARGLCRAPHFDGSPIPVTVRFSNGSGRPTRADGAHDERGMAVKFHLPGGQATDIVALTLPVFFVRTPQDFLALLEAQRPDPATGKPDLSRVMRFVEDHPEAQLALGFTMMSAAPASFAGCTFHAVHAFCLSAADGSRRYARYRWIPHQAAGTLSEEQTRSLGKDYLRDDLEQRLQRGRILFDLQLQLASADDDPSDPTIPWPEERRAVVVGRLTIESSAGGDCESMVFDPNRLVDGIEPSGDAILAARSAAYSVSHERRAGVR